MTLLEAAYRDNIDALRAERDRLKVEVEKLRDLVEVTSRHLDLEEKKSQSLSVQIRELVMAAHEYTKDEGNQVKRRRLTDLVQKAVTEGILSGKDQ